MEEKSKGLITTETFVIQYIPSCHFVMHVLRTFLSSQKGIQLVITLLSLLHQGEQRDDVMHHQSNLYSCGWLPVSFAQPLRNAVLGLLVVGVVCSRTTVKDDAQCHMGQVVHCRRNLVRREFTLQHCHKEILKVISVEAEHRGQAVQMLFIAKTAGIIMESWNVHENSAKAKIILS